MGKEMTVEFKIIYERGRKLLYCEKCYTYIDHEIVFEHCTPEVTQAILREHMNCKPLDIWE